MCEQRDSAFKMLHSAITGHDLAEAPVDIVIVARDGQHRSTLRIQTTTSRILSDLLQRHLPRGCLFHGTSSSCIFAQSSAIQPLDSFVFAITHPDMVEILVRVNDRNKHLAIE